MEFLGFIINGITIKPSPTNLKKISRFPVPKTVKALQSFLGLVNFNRRFIKEIAQKTAPLNKLTSTKSKFTWTNVHQKAFDNIKKELAEALSLNIPDWSRKFIIKTDTSKIAVGAVLCQIGDNGETRTLGYHSETLSKAGRNWSTTERELYGIISASRRWKTYCCDKITFVSDHEPLKTISQQKDPRGKIGHWILELENLDYQIKYIKGSENTEADYMSRILLSEALEEPEPPMIYHMTIEELQETLIKAQKADAEIASTTSDLLTTGKVSKGSYKTYSNLNILNGLLCKGKRIIIPNNITDDIIGQYHGQSHMGIEKTTLCICEHFYWRGMRLQIEKFVQNCQTCAKCKHGNNPKAAVQDHKSTKQFEMIAIDVASMPMSNEGNCCFLLIIDTFSKLAAAAALPNQRARTLVRALWTHWFSYFGIPKYLQSDQGKNVNGDEIMKLCKGLGIKKLKSSPYHPEGNGSAERAIGSLKTLVRSMCASRNILLEDWDKVLPEAMMNNNMAPNQSSKFSPYQTSFGINPHYPLDRLLDVEVDADLDIDMIWNNVALNKVDARAAYQKQANKTVKCNEYITGDEVLLKQTHGKNPKLNPLWVGPYIVVKKIGPVNFAIQDKVTKKTKIVHHNLLKPAVSKCDATIFVKHVENEISPKTSKVTVLHNMPKQPQVLSDSMNHHQFRQNVMSAPSPIQLNTAPTNPYTSRSGRISKPVLGSRLIDQLV